MEFRYSVKSNQKNKLIERTFYKKASDIFYIEKIQTEFNVISEFPLIFSWNGDEKYILINKFKDIFYGQATEKIHFTSGVSNEIKKYVKKNYKSFMFDDEIKKIGWKQFETISKIVGDSEIVKVPFNQLSLQATEIEIAYQNITDLQLKEYLENGLPPEEYDEISTSGSSGFCETDIKFEVNNEEVNIQKYISREFRKKNLNELLITRMQLPAMVVAHYFKRSYATLDIFEEFDPKKITLSIEKYVFKKGSNGYYFAYLPMYGEEDFTFESSGLHNYTDILLIDKKGKVHSIEVSDSESDSEDETDEY